MPFATSIYMDDLIVGSVNKEQHLFDLRCLFQRLKDKGLLLNRKKCELGKASLTFLGHVLNADIVVGVVLMQLQHGVWRPLSFWSKLLNKAQCGYSATEMELLAVSYAVDKFRSYLEGQPVLVRAHHNATVGLLTKKADTAIPIPRRNLLKIAHFVNKLHYLEGERNCVADALSRITLQPKNSALKLVMTHVCPRLLNMIADFVLLRF